MTYSHDIEMLTAGSWDPTFGSSEPGVMLVCVCHQCGSLIDRAAVENHDTFHARLEP